jgi:anthranilate phosphoribosyltransferase
LDGRTQIKSTFLVTAVIFLQYAQGAPLTLFYCRRDAVEKSTPPWFAETLAQLIERRDLSPQQMRSMTLDLISNQCGAAEAAALLVALRAKGETAAELAAAALVLREHMVPFDTGRSDVLDTCGTGGDGAGTFNISTATALVAAAAGVPVVKHGNRAVSSRSGSADVLAALGVLAQEDMAWARRCLEGAGLAFCFAPHFHPALADLGPLRRRLKIRTVFNCLGPLANPARAAFQLLGVGHGDLLDPMAGALAQLGVRHAFVVCGQDGLDEVTLAAPTLVREVRQAKVAALEWRPDDFGLHPCKLTDLRVTNAEESAAVIVAVLQGGEGSATDMVVANTAAALLAADHVSSLRQGVDCAAEALTSGRAWHVLQRLKACTPQDAKAGLSASESRQ